MSFNALSIAKIGIGFGTLAVASIGLISPAKVSVQMQVFEAGNAGHAKRKAHNTNWPYAKQTVQFDIDADDREIVEILTIMSTFL